MSNASADVLTSLGNHLIALHADPQLSQANIDSLATISREISNYDKCYNYVQNVWRVAQLDPRLHAICTLHLLRLSTQSPVFRRLYTRIFA